MESKNFVIGKHASETVLMKDRILVRPIKIDPKKGLTLYDSNNNKMESADIRDFHGFHPYIVEVLAVSIEAKEKGLKAGDIIAVGQRVIGAIKMGVADVLYIDGELLNILFYSDAICTMNYYRENIKKGKLINKKL